MNLKYLYIKSSTAWKYLINFLFFMESPIKIARVHGHVIVSFMAEDRTAF